MLNRSIHVHHALGVVALGALAGGCAAAAASDLPPAEEAPATAEVGSELAGAGPGANPWCAGPAVFAPGEISVAGRSEHRLAFSPDGKTVWFGVAADTFPFETLVESRLVGGHWTPAKPLPFSGVNDDTDAFLSPDGRTLYFSSDRPVNAGEPVRDDWEMWAVERTRTGWGEPYHLGPEVNDPAHNELYASVTRDGTLYFASDRPGGVGGWDLYRAKRNGCGFGAAENLGPEVNSTSWDYNPWISADGRFLVFVSLDRPGGYGLGDLYGSMRVGARFLPSHNLGPELNTAADEYTPTLSDDLRRVYFARQLRGPGDTSEQLVAPTTCFALR